MFSVPTVVVIDANGNIHSRSQGAAATEVHLRERIAGALLSEGLLVLFSFGFISFLFFFFWFSFFLLASFWFVSFF